MVIEADRLKFESRTKAIDYESIGQLFYLGNYVRILPISIQRMMENAHDWEHLPHVHSSTFSNIDLIENGAWGWRVKAEYHPAQTGAWVFLELIIDVAKNYWVTTTIEGPGAGVQIHTEASPLSDRETQIEIRFFSEEIPESAESAETALELLRATYEMLYDEDVIMMSDRQDALDRASLRRKEEQKVERKLCEVLVGREKDLIHGGRFVLDTVAGRYCVRRWRNDWIVHSADCPHMLGPLEDGQITDTGELICPWHGYKFSIQSGENTDGKCRSLKAAPELVTRQGNVFLLIGDRC